MAWENGAQVGKVMRQRADPFRDLQEKVEDGIGN